MADFSITGEVRLNSDPAEKSTSKWTVAAGNMIADFAKLRRNWAKWSKAALTTMPAWKAT